MKNIKQLGRLATGTSLLLWSAMALAQMGGYPQTQPGLRALGPMGAPGQPGTAGYPGQGERWVILSEPTALPAVRCRTTPS